MYKSIVFILIGLTASIALVNNTNATSLEQLCESDCKSEFNFFRKYAQQGSSLADFSLAIMYYRGQGTKVNVEAATRYLYKAAKAGEPGAQYQLGYFLMHGLYLKQDLTRARKWFKRAARKNTLDAKIKMTEIDAMVQPKTNSASQESALPESQPVAMQSVDQDKVERITVVMYADYRQILKAAKAQTCNASCDPYWSNLLAPLITLKSP